jgi:hypothetical protein
MTRMIQRQAEEIARLRVEMLEELAELDRREQEREAA